MPLAPSDIAPQDATFWWVALGMAVVVVLVVILLLSFLVRLVKEIDSGVVDIRNTLREISSNTDNHVLIAKTADRVDAVLDEGLNHHLFLGRKLAGAEPETAEPEKLVGKANDQ